jgi:mannosyltransferase
MTITVSRRYYGRIVLFSLIIFALESFHHTQFSNRVIPPAQHASDVPFQRGCNTPPTSPPARANATLLMLARNDESAGARAAVQSLEDKFNRWFRYPIVFLNDEPWSQEFVRELTNISSGEVFFQQVPKHLWGFPDFMGDREKDDARRSFREQRERGVLHGDQESYHHMIRFYSGYENFPSRSSTELDCWPSTL